MQTSSIFFLLSISVLVGMYLYAPFMGRARRFRAGESLQISALKAERDRIVNALQELDFDHNLGKIPTEDYPTQRAALLQKGADILRQLDELAPAVRAAAAGNVEARIEKAAAAARADSSAPKIQPVNDDDIEAMIAARRKGHKSKSAGFCPKCGKAILVTDKFCPSCGKSLSN
jgi:hypothetical protein